MDSEEKKMCVQDITRAKFRKINEKTYLFIEEDPTPTKCDVTLVNFLKFIINTYWKKADIFLELPFDQPKKRFKIYQAWHEFYNRKEYEHGFKSLYKNLKSCVGKYDKSILFYKQCPFDKAKVKVHVIDILEQNPIKFKGEFNFVGQYLFYYQSIKSLELLELEEFDVLVTKKPTLIDFIYEISSFMITNFLKEDNNLNDTFKKLLDALKIKKQISKIQDTNQQARIYTWLNFIWESTLFLIKMKELNQREKELNQREKELNQRDRVKNAYKILENIFQLSSSLVDAYTIARTLYDKRSNNYIIYGKKHKKNYVDLLCFIFPKAEKIEGPKKEGDCINLIKIVQKIGQNKKEDIDQIFSPMIKKKYPNLIRYLYDYFINSKQT